MQHPWDPGGGLYIYCMSWLSQEAKVCKFCYLFDINEGLGLLKLANTVLILINTSPSNVKLVNSLPNDIRETQDINVFKTRRIGYGRKSHPIKQMFILHIRLFTVSYYLFIFRHDHLR